MDDTQIQEASAVTSVVVGFSAYLHGINYSVEQFLRELDETVSTLSPNTSSSQGMVPSDQERGMQSATKASPVSVLRAGDVLYRLKRQQMSLFLFFLVFLSVLTDLSMPLLRQVWTSTRKIPLQPPARDKRLFPIVIMVANCFAKFKICSSLSS